MATQSKIWLTLINPCGKEAFYASKRREELGITLARAAELSGLELSEWCALESGWIPEDMNTIRAVAGTLRIDWKDLSFLACFAGSFQDCC